MAELKKNEVGDAGVVDLEVADGIATITVNRPEALNALNEVVVTQLDAAFDKAVARPDVKAVVIAGEGKAFIAGADIKFFVDNIEAGTIPKVFTFTANGHKLLRKLETSAKPVIAKVDGLSLGGGSELAMACTTIVVTERGGFGFPETGIGIYPGLGGSNRTARLIGKELAKYFVFTGQPLDGKTAEELGLAGYFVPSAEADAFIRSLVASPLPDKYVKKAVPESWLPLVEAFSDANIDAVLSGKAPNADPRVEKAVKALSRKAPLALKMANHILDEGIKGDLDAGLQLELDNLTYMFSTKDALVGLKSVGLYRPEFKGE